MQAGHRGHNMCTGYETEPHWSSIELSAIRLAAQPLVEFVLWVVSFPSSASVFPAVGISIKGVTP